MFSGTGTGTGILSSANRCCDLFVLIIRASSVSITIRVCRYCLSLRVAFSFRSPNGHTINEVCMDSGNSKELPVDGDK